MPRRFRVPLVRKFDPLAGGVLAGDDLHARSVHQTLRRDAFQRGRDIGLAGFQHQRPRIDIGHAAQHDRLYVRLLAPVFVEGFENDLDPRRRADEFVGAGADRFLLEPVLADFLDVVFRYDKPGGGGGAAVHRHEIGPDLLQMKADRTRIDDFDPRHFLLQLGGAGALIAVEAEFDVLGGQRIAVMKRQVRAQLEFVGQPVLALLPRFGERRTHIGAGIGPHQRVMQRVQNAERRDLRRRGRGIEPGRRDRHMKRQDEFVRCGGGEQRGGAQNGGRRGQRGDNRAAGQTVSRQGHGFPPVRSILRLGRSIGRAPDAVKPPKEEVRLSARRASDRRAAPEAARAIYAGFAT